MIYKKIGYTAPTSHTYMAIVHVYLATQDYMAITLTFIQNGSCIAFPKLRL